MQVPGCACQQRVDECPISSHGVSCPESRAMNALQVVRGDVVTVSPDHRPEEGNDQTQVPTEAHSTVNSSCRLNHIRKTGRLLFVLPQDQTRAKPEQTRPDQTNRMTRVPEDHPEVAHNAPFIINSHLNHEMFSNQNYKTKPEHQSLPVLLMHCSISHATKDKSTWYGHIFDTATSESVKGTLANIIRPELECIGRASTQHLGAQHGFASPCWPVRPHPSVSPSSTLGIHDHRAPQARSIAAPCHTGHSRRA
jgi:hypothetical protein